MIREKPCTKAFLDDWDYLLSAIESADFQIHFTLGPLFFGRMTSSALGSSFG